MLRPETIELKEHLKYAWVDVNELSKFDFLNGDKKFISQLEILIPNQGSD